MKKLIKYDGTKTYMYPNGQLATPERVLSEFPASLTFAHVIEVDENEEVLGAIMNLSQLRSIYSIDPALSETEAISELERILNNPPAQATDVTPEERIAAALEFNNLLNMPL